MARATVGSAMKPRTSEVTVIPSCAPARLKDSRSRARATARAGREPEEASDSTRSRSTATSENSAPTKKAVARISRPTPAKPSAISMATTPPVGSPRSVPARRCRTCRAVSYGLGMGDDALRLTGVGVTRGGRDLLDAIDWSVGHDQRWAVLGPNGSGKSTLVQIAALQLHPSRGDVDVLGQRLGRTDVRTLRQRIGYAAAALADSLRPTITARDVVMTARYAALEPWWHEYDDADRAEALDRLRRLGVDQFADREFGTLSSGERQRVLVARTLMGEVGLVLLDEPTAGLDLGGREQLVRNLDDLATDPTTPPIVLVTHHVEEIPPSFDHALLLRDGRVQAAGDLAS